MAFEVFMHVSIELKKRRDHVSGMQLEQIPAVPLPGNPNALVRRPLSNRLLVVQCVCLANNHVSPTPTLRSRWRPPAVRSSTGTATSRKDEKHR